MDNETWEAATQISKLIYSRTNQFIPEKDIYAVLRKHHPIKAGWVPGKILDELRHACKWAWDADNRNMVISRETIEAIISRYESAAPVDTGEAE